MKSISLIVVLTFTTVLQAQSFNSNYPKTKTVNQTDEYFGQTVADPYRWLEDDLSQETADWVKAQNKVTFDYLDKIPYREQLYKDLKDVYNYEKFSAPFQRGDYTYFYKNDGLQQHSVLYRESANGKIETFLDPNTFSKDGSISLSGISFSKDGSLCAYLISEGGADWRKGIIIDANSKKIVGDTLKDIKFSGLQWKGNEGLYYSTYKKSGNESKLSGKTDHHQLFYHKLNTKQSQDELIFGDDNTKRRYIYGYLTEDEKYLVISAANSTYGNELYYKNLTDNSPIQQLVSDFKNSSEIIDHQNGNLFVLTDINAPNKRLVKVDLTNPNQENWSEIIPEKKEVLSVSKAGGHLFAHYMKDASDKVYQMDFKGNLIREVKLPAIGSAGGFSGRKEDKDIYFSFTNTIYPTSIFKFNPKNGDYKLYKKPEISFNPDDYVTYQVFYKSKDGTKIPMTITHKKGLKKDGNNPTILYGYGGFNISLTPYFSSTRAVWLKHGGVLAVANLRGGGEYGKEWHKAGTQLQKKNVFNDFIAAAEYLVDNKITSKEKLALQGGSNGGLLVGAVSTMRPDLAKVALPAVGVLDMLRYHTFTSGAGWAYDYGTSEQSKEMFEYLLSYSPVHNVKANTCYPATMVTTGDHDDRVVPAHSYKYAAELQLKQSCDNPVLIRIETKAGHGAGKSTDVILNENADIFAFTLFNLGVEELD